MRMRQRVGAKGVRAKGVKMGGEIRWEAQKGWWRYDGKRKRGGGDRMGGCKGVDKM